MRGSFRYRPQLTVVLASTALVALCGRSWALAATFVVDTTDDAVDASPGDGLCVTASATCSLRAAVQESNALAGDDDITLPAGTYLLTLPPSFDEDAAADGDLDVLENLAISGAGPDVTTIDANGFDRVLEGLGDPPLAVTLSLAGVTLRNAVEPSSDPCDGFGFVELSGGTAICANAVNLELDDVAVRDNGGDAIIVLGSISIESSAIRDNQGTGLVVLLGDVVAINSTVSGNAATGMGLSGAVNATLQNVTISGNGSYGIDASGICESGFPCDPPDISLNNVTVANQAIAINNVFQVIGGSGGTFGVPTVVANSVLASTFGECNGEIASQGYNLFQTPSAACVVSGVVSGDVFGVPAFLGPLQSNGGATETHALLAPSPALNAGNPAPVGGGGGACEAVDQRGVSRPIAGLCDMGAFESSCGDGSTGPGEACDDGNALDGDACQHNCALPGCGDTVVTAPEECDVGDTSAGDCCSASCSYELEDAPCTSDGDLCTADVCDGAGSCLHEPLGCERCQPAVATCMDAAAAGSQLTIKNKEGSERDLVSWKWKVDAPITKDQLGAPAATSGIIYDLCLFDGGGGPFLLASVTSGCDDAYCWKETAKSFRLKSGPLTTGKVSAVLTASEPGKLRFKTRGAAAGLPGLPLSPPFEVRLTRSDNGACWNAHFESSVPVNTPDAVKAKSD